MSKGEQPNSGENAVPYLTLDSLQYDLNMTWPALYAESQQNELWTPVNQHTLRKDAVFVTQAYIKPTIDCAA